MALAADGLAMMISDGLVKLKAVVPHSMKGNQRKLDLAHTVTRYITSKHFDCYLDKVKVALSGLDCAFGVRLPIPPVAPERQAASPRRRPMCVKATPRKSWTWTARQRTRMLARTTMGTANAPR